MLGSPGISVECVHEAAIATIYFASSSSCLAGIFAMTQIFSFCKFLDNDLLSVVQVCIFRHSELSVLADGKPRMHETHGADVYKLTIFGGLFVTGAEGKP